MNNHKTSSARTKLHFKVCGMGHAENILEVASLKPDYLGFIFFEGSPRNFTGRIPPLPERIYKTGVFVNASAEFILEKIRDYELQAVQLHGEESADFCQNLKAGFPKGRKVVLIKVFSVRNTFNFEN
jgi:phosphoribosylanthranilate isomerase